MSLNPDLSEDQEEAIGRYQAGEMTSSERIAFEREVIHNDDLAEALYQQREMAGFLTPKSAAPPRPQRPSRTQWSVAGLLTVAAVASIFLITRPGSDMVGDEPVFRGDGNSGPTPVAAEGILEAWPTFLAWRAVPGAERYRVQLRDDQSLPLLIRATTDTLLSLAREQLPPELPSGGHWQVTPIFPGDREGPAGPLVRFEVRDR